MNAGRKHKTRSRVLILLLIVLLALLAGALWAKYRWQAMLAQSNIEHVQWQGVRLGLHGVSVAELRAVQQDPERRLTIDARDITLGWRWDDGSKWQWRHWLPQLHTLSARQLELDIVAAKPELAGEPPSAEPAFSLLEQMPPSLSPWLPSRIRVQQFQATLPCASGRCLLQGAVDIQQSAQETENGLPINASLSLEHQGHRVYFVAELSSLNAAPAGQGLQMSATVEIDNTRYLTLETRYQPLVTGTDLHWEGTLAVPELPNAEWLIAWVQSWVPLPEVTNFAQPEQGSLNLHWALRGPRQSFLAKAPGKVNVEVRLSANLARLDVGQWRIDKPELALLMSGELTPTHVNLTFAESSRVSASQIKSLAGTGAGAFELQNPQLALAGNNLTVGFNTATATLENLAFSGPLDINIRRIKHPQLLTQGWQFNGKTNANMNGLQWSGIVKAKSGTSANINLKAPYGSAAAQAIGLNGEMRVSGKREMNSLGRVFVAWPELLDASGGTISANVNVKLPPGQPLDVDGKLVFVDVGGTWDRTAWRNMNGTVDATLKSDQFQLSTSQLTLGEINPGVPLGPIILAGGYRASTQQPIAGQLTLSQANAGALGGHLNIAPGRWDFASAPVTVPLELDRLNLGQLLQVYPAEGVAGTGILNGTIPLLIDPAAGVRVKRGRLSALEPGGQLQLSAERLRALGQNNETMKLVSKALENFRYSALSSDIDYHEDGTLILSLHLKGNSPEVGDGRAVVLNINLEENIPALLTSLQLSGRVTDAVAERVRNLLKKREREPAEDLIQ